MNDKSIRLLEFDKIKTMLSDRAVSSIGVQQCLNLTPSSELALVVQLQEETAEAEQVLFGLGSSPIEPFDDITLHLKRAQVGSVLTMKELLDTARFLRAVRSTLQHLTADEARPILTGYRSQLAEDKQLETDISGAILSEEEMHDSASTELYQIRRKYKAANAKVRELLNNYIRSPQYAKYLQEAIVTIRGDRYVLPIKAEHKSQFPGLVHDQSSSGATLFVEPMAVVQANNEIRELKLAEAAEIERILTLFTERVAELADMLLADLEVMGELDFIFSRAKLSKDWRCVKPSINDQLRLNIRAARHPLIPSDRVVPIDIRLGTDFHLLIVTGPNTGGKTVTLKTAGLFCLMAQSGLHLPAAQADMPLFEEVFADIGDAQSIEQSLSTFSSHMTNIAQIVRDVTMSALVLFDELGAGTDPDEGAALAMSILDYLRERGVRTIATTHYSELKAYSMTTEGAENASVEFNVKTLSPTYKLLIGVPGGSNAFAIASRLGLSEAIIQQAKGYLSHEALKIEDILNDAEQHRQETARELEAAMHAREEAEAQQRAAESKLKAIENRQKALLEQAEEKAKDILNEAYGESEAAIRELKQLMQAADEKALQKARQIKTNLSGKKQPKETQPSRKSETTSVQAGQAVHVISLDADGEALSAADAKGMVEVSLGNMKVRVPLEDLEATNARPAGNVPRGARHQLDNVRTAALEIDVRGMNVEEAIMDIDKFIDNAFLSSLQEIVIIHGKGTGVLREGIRRYLRTNRHVKTSRPGLYGEGEQGVTVVTLK